MPDVCIVSGSRIDDIAASVIVRKILKTNGITSGTPYFAADPAAFLFTPHYRAWRDLELPIIFVGIPLDPVTMSYWAEIWRRFCNDKNINMPFYYDNRLSSQNTFSESPYAMVSCGESLAMAAYNMAEHLSVNADDYNSMAIRDENLVETYNRNMPESYDKYQINIPNELLDHDEELFKQFYEHGFTNDQAQFVYDLANERVIPVLDQLTVNFEAQKQLAKLTNYFGGRERFDEVSRQISAWAKQNLSTEVYDALGSTAEGVIALYKMMSSNEPMLSKDNGYEGELNEQTLRKMMEDPRYWRDKDSAYINKITRGFEKLYPEK